MIYETNDFTCQLAVPHKSSEKQFMGSRAQGALCDLLVSGLDLSYAQFSIYIKCCVFVIWLKTKHLHNVLVYCCVVVYCSAENKQKKTRFVSYI